MKLSVNLKECVRRIHDGMDLGMVPVIVMGSGMSTGVGAPLNKDIHAYLRGKFEEDVEAKSSSEKKTISMIRQFLSILAPELGHSKFESPRSVSARLFDLLQTSMIPSVRENWRNFAVDLFTGQLFNGQRALYELEPSRAHFWAARFALNHGALLISLNYDGLTKRAADFLLSKPPHGEEPKSIAWILTSASQIRQYFTRRESSVDDGEVRLPIIKLRGDVFHAVCHTAGCPESEKLIPLYELANRKREEKTKISEKHDQEKEKSSGKHDSKKDLSCQVCRKPCQIQINFPGVFFKEKDIEDALAAFHETCGSRIAGVVFLGFSGKWDQALVRYLVKRCSELGSPVISVCLHKEDAIAIERASKRHKAQYGVLEYNSKGGEGKAAEKDEFLDTMINSFGWESTYRMAERVPQLVEFPGVALDAFKSDEEESVELHVSPKRNPIIIKAGKDEFCGMAESALSTNEMQRLKNCSQLGFKCQFLQEGSNARKHTRYVHSSSACLISMIWYESLLSSSPRAATWGWSKEGRLALELAVLFHDARHLPFSHTMEEIFEELNWGSGSPPEWIRLIKPNSSKFREQLKKILHSDCGVEDILPGDWWERVERVQNGLSGLSWMDAIMDSAIDADKIDYIFRDSKLAGQSIRLPSLPSWLQDFLGKQSITSEGLIRLEGSSSLAALALLEERFHLYRTLYLAPELRALESIAKYIVTTWLEWNVPQEIRLVDSHGDAISGSGDLREKKAGFTGELLWKLFEDTQKENKNSSDNWEDLFPPRDIECVEKMATMLVHSDGLDLAAKESIDQLKLHLTEFSVTPDPSSSASMKRPRDKLMELAPIGPFYIHWDHEKEVRHIVRQFRVHYPLLALIDISKFPKFLPIPKKRTISWLSDSRVTAEHFLVPGPSISEWYKNSPAATPLSLCDFSSFELPFLQLLIIDPWSGTSGGSSFIYQMFRKALKEKGIELWESPESMLRMSIK